MQELLKNLSKEISYQWRVQSYSRDKSKAICTSYIDARDVMKVLDTNCIWQSQYKEISGFIFCGIGIYSEQSGEWVWRWDCGARVEENKDDQMYEQAGKSASSDAFKRAAVQWGIGRFLYDIPLVTLPCDANRNVIDEKGQRIWDLTKHINGMKKPSPPSALPVLTPDKFDSMVKFISDGKYKDVEKAMKNYALNSVQTEVLVKMINQAKAESVLNQTK